MRKIRFLRDLFRTPWSVSTVARRDEVAWFSQNVLRQRMAMSKLERDLLFAGEHPLRLAFSLLALQITLLVLVAVLPQSWFTPSWSSWGGCRTTFSLLCCVDHPGDASCAGLPYRNLLRCRLSATQARSRSLYSPLHARFGRACSRSVLARLGCCNERPIPDAEYLGNDMASRLGGH